MIDELIRLLEAGDVHFASFWQGLDESGRRACRQLLLDIQRMGPATAPELTAAHSANSTFLRHYFACVPHKEMDFGRKPRDWSAFVADEEAKNALFVTSRAILDQFCGCLPAATRPSLYGGIKPLSSLDRRAARPASPSGPRRHLDTWDIVRFRLVAKDLAAVRATASAVWECFLDGVVRCTNFYLSPLRTDHPYRAIHFEIEIQAQRWIEIQVLSGTRDLIGRLDYAPLFKKSITLPSAAMFQWLADLSLRANLHDAGCVPKFPFDSVWAVVPP